MMSLKLQQYYGNPRNQFWRIVYSLFEREPDLLYENRVAFLREKRIALWDVIDSCERKGSLDSAIKHEKANDLNGLFRNYPAVGLVVFNGTKAERSFLTDISLESSIEKRLMFRTVPSSSPANAVQAEVKRSEWSIIKTYLVEQGAHS